MSAVDEPGTDLVAAPPPPVTLFRTEKPHEVVAVAAETANALASVVDKRKLSMLIQGRKYVLVEGWTLLGTMLGVFPICVWSRQLENGWEARVEARRLDGSLVGAAEAMCVRSERSWATRPDYALRSMCQTRATSKALRQPLGFVMTMAGYESTPAEEMTGDIIEDAVVTEIADKPAPAPAPAGDEPLASELQAKNIWRLVSKLDKAGTVLRADVVTAIGQEYGTEKPDELTKKQASDLITRLKAKAGEDT